MKRLHKCILLLFIALVLGVSTASAFEVSPANPTVGDEITISGTASGDSVDASVAFTESVDVANGEYEYTINGVEIPSGDNRFKVQAEGVQDLNVQVKILFWITKSADASGGVATVSQSNVPSGNYNIKIDGNAASGQSNVDLTINATQTMDITNGQFEETYSTSSIPAGDFSVTVGGETKTITLSSIGSGSSSGSSESSSNTGGGGGTTPDVANGNVDASESITKRVFSDMPVEYQFSHSSMPVRSVNITSRITAMDIPVNVEVLDDTSVMVKKEPSGKIYKHLNIWVGSTGFAVPENINSATIHFRVDNDWIHNNDIDPDTIVLMHYEEEAEEWTKLPTEQVSKNEEYTNYRASTPHFSPFAIIGKIDQETIDNTTNDTNSTNESQNSTINNSDITDNNPTGETDNQSIYTNAWIFALIITGIVGIIILKMRKS
ncbi:PGF-pre-PGF domain-containing protein [Methanohalophilus profundi]|uniref:PGF-pre-PGF domain-containing protein n=1 Tax=Methanohalophilus profundi TaxID=2138083 RepID=UPI00101BF0DC|nr:PGF-pre-PGF domain-containing protein [Methanohalophilus profundi]